MMDKSCLYTLHFSLTVVFFAWPLYTYFIYIWHMHRNHFVILNRWPIISLIMVATCVIIQILTLIEGAFCIKSISPVSAGLCNLLFGLAYYRTYLLYAQTMKARYYLEFNSVKLTANDPILDPNKGYLGRLILSAVILLSILVIFGHGGSSEHSPIAHGSFTATFLIGVVCFVNIVRKKVSDSIGVVKESILGFAITLMILSLVIFASIAKTRYPSHVIEIIRLWMRMMASVLYGLAMLFIPYNLVRKETIVTHQSSGLNLPRQDVLSAAMQHLPPLNDPRLLSMWLEKPLVVFLHNKMGNLQLFAGYLSECFALENILFLERAIVLHHVIRKWQRKDATTLCSSTQKAVTPPKAFRLLCYELKFAFLTQIYDDMGTIIGNENAGHKRGIAHVMKAIHGQFCSPDAQAEINVGYEIKNKLNALFEGKTEDEIVQELTTYDDMLEVFDDAIKECWALCESIYHFQFKAYLEGNVLPQKEDETIESPVPVRMVSVSPANEVSIPSPVSQ
eukprot:4802_1